jgi:hypothetical protein
LALEFANKLINETSPQTALAKHWPQYVFDGLELKSCGDSSPSITNLAKARAVIPEQPVEQAAVVFYADANASVGGDGSLNAPFPSVADALEAVRNARHNLTTPSAVVYLRAGTFFVQEEIVLSELDSNLTISAYQGEEVWLSGGVPLESPSWSDAGGGVWQTRLEGPGIADIPSLFTLRPHTRLNKARFPNADPEIDKWGFPGWGVLGPCEVIDQPCNNGSTDGSAPFALAGDGGQFTSPDVVEWWLPAPLPRYFFSRFRVSIYHN